MINHLINDGELEAGGAQGIMHVLCDSIPCSRIFSFNYKQSIDGSKASYGVFRCYIKYILIFFFRKKQLLVVHHRVFLIPLILFKRKNFYFICHNVFPKKNWIFNYVRDGHFVAVSKTVKDYLEVFSGGYSISIIENGIKFDKFSKRDVNNDELYRIAYVGRMSEQKGVDLLIKAFLLMKEVIPKSELVLIGDGESIAQYKDIAKYEPSIIFKGYAEFPFRLCKNSDVMVVPSRYEGFGLVYYEALEYGHSVIASDLKVFQKKEGDVSISFFQNENILDLKDKLLLKCVNADGSNSGKNRHSIKNQKQMIQEYLSLFNGNA